VNIEELQASMMLLAAHIFIQGHLLIHICQLFKAELMQKQVVQPHNVTKANHMHNAMQRLLLS
jgi:hypothetical protein